MQKNKFLCSSVLSKLTMFILVVGFLVSPLSIIFAEDTTAPAVSTPSVDTGTTVTTDTTPSTDTTVTNPTDTTTNTPDPTVTTPTDLAPAKTDVSPDTTTSLKQSNVTMNSLQGPGVTQPYNTSGTSQILQPKTDANTGALTFEYPIKVPPGRNGQAPDLKLSYNSRDNYNNSIFGYGWSSNIPYIERINKDGTNHLYSESYFYSSTDGELVSQGSGVFTPKTESGSFSKYNLSSNQWLITDKQGTTYKFGYSSATRQDDPNDGTHIFKWMLEEIKDTNGNFITYTYYKDAGQIYPSTITYSNNGANPGIFEVDFLRTSRSDAMPSSATGFLTTTNYVINEIDIKVNSNWTSKYVLNYSSGANGNRSLLSSITQSGQDVNNTVTTLPATTFSYTQSTPGFTDTSKGASYIPVDTRNGVLPADVNGDGYPDLLQSWEQIRYNYSSQSGLYLYHPELDNWQLDTTRPVPSDIFISRSDNYYPYGGWSDAGTKANDVNGDGLNDLIRFDGSQYSFNGGYSNNGSAWTSNSNWFLNKNPYANIDINGDGLLDFIGETYEGSWVTNIDWNTGSNFNLYQAYTNDPFKVPEHLKDQIFADVNGDGLPDIIKSTYNYQSGMSQAVYINTGTGWVLDSSYTLPSDLVIYSIGPYDSVFTRLIIQDVNQDGLPDIIVPGQVMDGYNHLISNLKVYINKGHNWDYDSNWNTFADLGAIDTHSLMPGMLIDANGDGSVDIINQGFDSWGHVTSNDAYFNNTNSPVDLLSSITLPTGGQTTVAYKMSAQYKDGSGNLLNPNLPLNLATVYQITADDGNGNSGTTTYSYQGGSYFFNTSVDRKFAGFNKVTATDPNGNTITTYYHQGNTSDTTHGEYNDDEWKIGKPYRVEMADSSGNLYSVNMNKWDEYDLGSGSKFVKLARTTTLTYDGISNHKDTAQEYTYNNTYGNLTGKTDWGEVTGSTDGSFTDTGSDKSVETISYVANTSNYVVGLPYDDTTVDQNSNKVNETRTYYDTNSLGTVGLGNPTKTEKWVTGTTYVNTQKSYDGTYGLVSTSTDPDNNVTSYTYDSYHLYPTTITDAFTHTTNYNYDYSGGKVIQTTDQNGFIYQTNYDGLDRIIEQKIPGVSSPYTPITKTTYAYTDTGGAVSIHKTDYLDSSTTTDIYQYFDGFGRLIQNRKEAETSGNFNVSDTVYNNIGLVQKESLPYTGSGSSKTSPTTTTALYTTYTYDPINRPLTSVNAVGTTSYAYNLWKTSVTDPNGKIKDTYSDARGNLIRVDEHNSGSTYTTTYTWNLNSKLLSITDALGNVRNFTYDGVGNRLTAQDLHASGDSTYGTWSYTYDNAGNMTQSVNPNANTTIYTYDSLSRVLTENYTGATGTEIIYSYDSCTNGINKLCSVTMTSGANTSYIYDADGNVASEVKTINTVAYTTSYTYDRQGNQLIITYPDSAQVRYTYNTAGLLNQVERKESAGSFTNVISNIDYSPTDQITVTAYANGLNTTNTYDASNLYRLSNKRTSMYAPDPSYGNPVITLSGSTLISKTVGDIWTEPGYSATDPKYGNITSSVTITGSVNTAVAGVYQLIYSVVDIEGAYAASMIRTIVVSNAIPRVVKALVVGGGGGGGGGGDQGGGGGAGGYQYNSSFSITPKNYYVIVGTGGAGGGSGTPRNGNDSVFDTITAIGGGYGGNLNVGQNGGCGGGGEGFYTNYGNGSQGGNGGSGSDGTYRSGGGGGGAGGNGQNGNSTTGQGGNGGVGIANSISGSSVYYAGGGGGSTSGSTLGLGGAGGGGVATNSGWGGNGTDGLGGGGGAIKGNGYGGYGGSGVVIIAYHTDGSDGVSSSSTGGTKTTSGLYTIHTFTSNGTFTAVAPSPTPNTNPVITLTGSNLINLTVGDTWTEPGYSATDTEDGNLTSSVIVTGSVNTATIGTYQLVYKVVDSKGAPAARMIRTIVVHRVVNDLQNISYTYDANGNITQLIDSSTTNTSKTANYTYDDLYRLTSATITNVPTGQTGLDANVVPRIMYWQGKVNQHVDTHGNWQTDPDGVSGAEINKLTYCIKWYPNSIGVENYMLETISTWRARGNINAYTGTIMSSRCIQPWPTAYTQNFTYDSIGNITSKSDVGNYVYAGNTGSDYANPHAVTLMGGVANTYDHNGNLLTDGTLTNTWNYKNQLTQTVKGTTTLTYAYDNNGQRVKLTKGTVTTSYPNKYYNYDGTKKTKSIYAGDQLIATIETVGGVVTPYYDHTDHLDSVAVVSNSSGAQTELLDYYPFGTQRISSGSYSSQRRSLSQIYDVDTNLNYYNARYQNGLQGRFISEDPMFWNFDQTWLADPQQQNSYSYGRDNPINRSDPDGKLSIGSLSMKNIGNAISNFMSSLFGGSTQKSTPVSNSSNTLVSYKGSNFTGIPVQANPNFINGLKETNQIAQNNKVMVNVTSTGVRSAFANVDGAIVQQSDRSNHYTGSAIDMNVISGITGKNCNSSCLGTSKMPPDVSGFIKDVSSSPTLRWGGEWKGAYYDPVHIDAGFNVNDFSGWKRAYESFQGAPYKE